MLKTLLSFADLVLIFKVTSELNRSNLSIRDICFLRKRYYFYLALTILNFSCISLISFEYFHFRSPIYSLLVTGENFLVTGDDDGHIKVRKSM